jgi:hypothetical protein
MAWCGFGSPPKHADGFVVGIVGRITNVQGGTHYLTAWEQTADDQTLCLEPL